ncbi:MAG: hypothetical protein H0T89_10600 [Deltaproteobacteria bacterium]|nr:hypothetical protein [Deltaproteobacteria bacterium]MDQ3296718.1 hypothetical protein [Myxococcota bacterium]
MRVLYLAVVPAFAAVLAAGCARRDPPPVKPAPPLPADPARELQTMQIECDGMIAALAAYKACPNLEEADLAHLDDWIETADRAFAASRKAKPEPNAQNAIAGACRKATESVRAAAERCAAGPRPKID